MDVGSSQIDLVPVNRDGTLVAGVNAGRQEPCILPQQVACGGIQRFEFIAGAVQKHHAVMNYGRGFIGARRKRPSPRHAQTVHIGFHNLLERAESLIIEAAAPSEPVALGRVLQQRVGDGSDFVERVGLLRRRRKLHASR
jgi:hypothetical protein